MNVPLFLKVNMFISFLNTKCSTLELRAFTIFWSTCKQDFHLYCKTFCKCFFLRPLNFGVKSFIGIYLKPNFFPFGWKYWSGSSEFPISFGQT